VCLSWFRKRGGINIANKQNVAIKLVQKGQMPPDCYQQQIVKRRI